MAILSSGGKLFAVSSTLGLAILASHSANAQIVPFADDFEAMAVSDGGSDLADAGWLVGGNVFATVDASGNVLADPFSAPKFFYGLFTAPNGGPGFSSVATGDGHPGATDASGNYLNIYSDYNCCGLGTATAEGHGNATDIVNSIVLKQFPIVTADIGKTVTLAFDVKRPEFQDDGFGTDTSAAIGNGCSGNFDMSGNLSGYATSDVCAASAFIKTLDPGAGFAETNLVVLDTTTVSQSDWTSVSITLDITDPLLDGQLLQIGFQNFAQDFNNTGVYYDNVTLSAENSSTPVNVPVPALAALGLGLLLAGVVTRRKRATA